MGQGWWCLGGQVGLRACPSRAAFLVRVHGDPQAPAWDQQLGHGGQGVRVVMNLAASCSQHEQIPICKQGVGGEGGEGSLILFL